MKLKKRIKTYSFWVSMASAVLLIISTLGKKFNFSVDEKMYNDLFSAFCAILILLGVIVPPTKKEKKEQTLSEEETEEVVEENVTSVEESVTLEREDGKIITKGKEISDE